MLPITPDFGSLVIVQNRNQKTSQTRSDDFLLACTLSPPAPLSVSLQSEREIWSQSDVSAENRSAIPIFFRLSEVRQVQVVGQI